MNESVATPLVLSGGGCHSSPFWDQNWCGVPQPNVHFGLPHCTPSALRHPQRHLTGWDSMEVPIHPPQECWLPESTVVREFHTWISVLVHV